MKNNIQAILILSLGIVLAGCRELENLQAPGGEMAFCIGTNGVVGEILTRGVVPGEPSTSVTSLQLICFDPSGYYLGTRTAYPKEDSVDPTKGTFSGYVPESTARIHFVANAVLDLSEFAVGVSEKVIMTSGQLSTQYSDIDPLDASAPKLCYWGYHKEDTADEMKTWLQEGLPAKGSGTPNTVSLLRDRARIQLTVGSGLYNTGAWLSGSAGTGKTITSIKWGITNGRERGYLAPPASSWAGYAGGSVAMHEYEDCNRYVLSETQMDAFDPSGANFQYVFDDSNKKTTMENGRVVLVLEVNYDEGGTPGKKYLLAQLRVGSGANEGEMTQIIRNSTYVVNVTDLSHDGYVSFAEAVNPNADDFTNAPADVDVTVPYIMDGMHVLNLISPKPAVVTRTAGQNYTVEFEYTKASAEAAPVADDFVIEWEERINDGWTFGPLTVASTGTANVYRGTFTVTIGTIGTSYAYSDHLVIRHKKSGLSRYIHFYAVEQFIYKLAPTLEQVMLDANTPYLGPSGDDTGRPVFKLTFRLSPSVQEDLFPLTVRIASSTLEPFGDKTTSATARLSGGFAIENASTARSMDGTALSSSSSVNDWNYKSDTWGYWYDYTLQEYPKTGSESDGEVVIYLKDIRDAYAQSSEQAVGLYLDVANFQPYGLTIPVSYPSYAYQEGLVAGSYTVGSVANKYRLTITGAAPGATYTLTEETDASWLTENPTSITADASGNLVFKFSVSANTAGERSANVIFTNSANTSLKTKMTIIQESGMEPDFRVKAESTSVMGSTREVKLTVYSDVDWTLETSAGGLFSSVSTVVQDATNHVHGSSSSVGIPVMLTMPVNYTTSDILYTVTLSKTAEPSVTKTVVITQRKVKEFQEGKTATFTAGTHFESGKTDSSGGIIGTFPSKPSTAGGGLDFTVRWDFVDNTTLALTKEDSVLEMTGFSFEFHSTLVSGTWSPDYLHVVDNSSSNSWDLAPSSTTSTWNWNPANDPSTGDPLTFTDLSVTFVKGAKNIGMVSFTVTYTGVIWE